VNRLLLHQPKFCNDVEDDDEAGNKQQFPFGSAATNEE